MPHDDDTTIMFLASFPDCSCGGRPRIGEIRDGIGHQDGRVSIEVHCSNAFVQCGRSFTSGWHGDVDDALDAAKETWIWQVEREKNKETP